MNRLAAGLLATISTEPPRVNKLAQGGYCVEVQEQRRGEIGDTKSCYGCAHRGLLCRPKGPDMSAYIATVRQFSRKMC
jgi:hypothetical protein